MSMKMVCNRCNKVKEDGEPFSHIHYVDGNNRYESSEYDLCPECAKRFSMFIDGGTVEEDHYKDSKPCAVVIHKLCDGNYIVENKPDKGEAEPGNAPDFVDRVVDAVSDNPDDPCPCYAKHCIHIATCCGCKEYDEWKERQKK